MRRHRWLKHIILWPCILLLLFASIYLAMYLQYKGMNTIAAKTYGIFDFNGKELVSIGEVKKDYAIVWNMALSRGKLTMRLIDDKSQNIEFGKTIFFDGMYWAFIENDGEYFFELTGEQAHFGSQIAIRDTKDVSIMRVFGPD